MMRRSTAIRHCRRGFTVIELLVSISVIGLLVALQGSLCAADSVREVVQVWRQRQQEFQTVRFQFSGEVTIPEGFLMDSYHRSKPSDPPPVPFPSQTETHSYREELLLDMTAGRRRQHVWSRQPGLREKGQTTWTPLDQLYVYDGVRTKTLKPMDKNVRLGPHPQMLHNEVFINKPSNRPGGGFENLPLMLACGIVTASGGPWPTGESALRVKIDPEDFHLETQTQYEGRPCLILKTVPDKHGQWKEYHVDAADPRMIYRLNHYADFLPDKLVYEITISYRTTDHGPVPDHWTIYKHSPENNKLEVMQFELDDVSFDVPVSAADFDVVPEPGMLVMDRNLPKDEQHYVAAAAGELRIPFEEYMQKKQVVQEQSRNWLLYGLVAVGLALLLAGWLRYRQRTA